MKRINTWTKLWVGTVAALLLAGPCLFAQTTGKVQVDWSQVQEVSKTTPTLQVVVNPPLRRGSKIHDRVYENLKALGADYVRYVPWLPYPKLAVAELEPPANGKTSWDFSLIDPMIEDFMNAQTGHSVVINFSTIPQWMWKTEKPVAYPSDPNQVDWHYTQGSEPRDPSMKEVADYYARLVSWYTQGGFTDEYGKRHESGHHYKIQYWEVLNEVDFEHNMTPEFYTHLYDAVTAAIHEVDPSIKFVGAALAAPSMNPKFFEYFLNHRNHKAGTQMEMISYHFYAHPTAGQNLNNWQYTFWDQADRFLDTVRFIQGIRQRLSPETETDMDELGCILPYDTADHLVRPIPNGYWNLCGAMYAYLYAQLAHDGIEVAGESQLVGYPTQFPSVSMVNWTTGQPNARFWVLKLLHDNFSPGDKLVKTEGGSSAVYAQGFVTPSGLHKLLLINQRNRPTTISLPDAAGASEQYVNEETAENGVGTARLARDEASLGAFEVSVITMP
jgi:Glycosyl hydrolases family 39